MSYRDEIDDLAARVESLRARIYAEPEPKETPEPVAASRKPVAWAAHVKRILGEGDGEQFIEGVLWIEDDLGIDADDLMSCMAFETGRKFRSNTRSPVSSATGLIQFMRATALKMGTTVEALAAMPEIKQLSYVHRYFKETIAWAGPLKDIADVYMAILYPKAIGKPMSFPLFVRGDANYTPNAGLDANRDAQVSKAEAASKVMAMLAEGLRPGNVG